MVEKKKGKQNKDEEEKLTSEEHAVAKHLRFSLPVKEGRLHGMDVKYFIGSEAVDKLMESKWSAAKSKDAIFTSREKCVAYMSKLLKKNVFHRAEREKRKKDKVKDKSTRKKIKDKEEGSQPEEEPKERKTRREKKSKKDKEAEGDEETEKKVPEKKDEKKKKEKRIKLIMPEDQFFADKNEVFVWIFDPVNAKNFFIGLLMVLGAIALCMFPLWPEAVRVGVYYISVAAAGFVGFILCLVVVRLILFCCIWVLTFGRHHFWFLPNLTEDVGFFDSFRPLYKHDVFSKDTKSVEGKKKGGKVKDETNKPGLEAIESKKEKSSDKEDSDEFELIKNEDLVENDVEEDEEDEEAQDDRAEENDDSAGSADVDDEDKANMTTDDADTKKTN